MMHGALWMDDRPVEIAVPRRTRGLEGVLVHRDVIAEDEVCLVDGLRCATPVRTVYDLGRSVPGDLAIALIDSICRATGVKLEEVEEFTTRYPGARNCRRLLSLLPYADAGAESIPETMTRLLLHRSGLPKPETQIVVSHHGAFIARLDMGYRNWQVAIEYDGAQHWTDPRQRTRDLDRHNDLAALGWLVIRTNATLLAAHPRDLVDQVRSALLDRGYRP